MMDESMAATSQCHSSIVVQAKKVMAALRRHDMQKSLVCSLSCNNQQDVSLHIIHCCLFVILAMSQSFSANLLKNKKTNSFILGILFPVERELPDMTSKYSQSQLCKYHAKKKQHLQHYECYLSYRTFSLSLHNRFLRDPVGLTSWPFRCSLNTFYLLGMFSRTMFCTFIFTLMTPNFTCLNQIQIL